MHIMDLHYHPLFNRWLSEITEADGRLEQKIRLQTETKLIVARGNR